MLEKFAFCSVLAAFLLGGCTATSERPETQDVSVPPMIVIEANSDDGIVVSPEKIQDAHQDENAPVLPAYSPWWK